MNKSESLNIVDCLGVDGKNHKKVSWQPKALCGMKIARHGFNNNLFSCWGCDGISDVGTNDYGL